MMLLLLCLSSGEEYLTLAEALRLALAGADSIVECPIRLEAGDVERVRQRYGSNPGERHVIYLGVKNGSLTGYAMIVSEITKTLSTTFVVGTDPRGAVTRVAVMRHEEHIGTECRRERFLEQFGRKRSGDRIRIGGDILPISGATLSCNAVARGVRKAVAILQHHFVDRPENAACALQEAPIRRQRFLMGTLCTITARAPADTVEKAFDAIGAVETALSNYREDSELAVLHRERSVKPGRDLLDFIRTARRHSEASEGAFDITVGPLMRLWGFRDGQHRVPSDREITDALQSVGYAKIEADETRVRLPEGAELDPGGIGKGIGVDRAVAVLRAAGVESALVDFGSTMAAVGRPPGEEGWTVAVRDPFDPSRTLGTLVLRDESLSTSGSYEKYFEKDGRRYTHILDPRTGRPVEGIVSVSVLAPTGTESDALSTAVFVLKRIPGKVDAFLVPEKGEPTRSEGWRKRFRPETK